jgi:hyperosmotically inducible periplasmic protein
MNFKHTKLFLASSMMLGMLSTGTTFAAESACQSVDDSRREAQIWTTYALSPYLRANELEVSVKDGKATLSGEVEEDVNRDLAEQIARGVKGVNNVDNKIVVRADYTPRPRGTERSYGEVVDDASVASAVRSKLQWSKHTEGLNAKARPS